MSRNSIDYPTTQNMIEGAVRDVLKEGQLSQAAIGGFHDLTPIGPWPISVKEVKGKARVTLKVAVPAGTTRLKTVLEQYTGTSTSVVVVKRFNDTDKELPESLGATGGVFTYEFDVGLPYNSKYGCPKLVAIMTDGSRVSNPTTEPDPSARVEADYFADSLFTLGDALGAPSGPNSALIVYNELDPITPDIYDAHVGLKVYAPLTDGGAAQTWGAFFGDNQSGWVQAIITRDFSGTIAEYPFRHVLTDTELTQVDAVSTPTNRGYVVLEANKLVVGGTYVWTENKVFNNGEKRTSTGSVTFIAANFQLDVSQLTNTALSVVQVDPFNGKHVKPRLELTQPWPNPVALRNFTAFLKKHSDTDWGEPIDHRVSIQSEKYHLQLNAGTVSLTSGLKTVVGVGTNFTRLSEGWKIIVGAQTLIIGTITDDTHMTVTTNSASSVSGSAYTIVIVITIASEIKVKPSIQYDLKLVLRARGFSGSSITTLNLTFTTGIDDDVAIPGALNFPTISLNTTDNDPDKSQARVTFTLSTANAGTFVANNTKSIGLVFSRVNADGTVDSNSNFTEYKQLVDGEFGLSSVVFSVFFRLGAKFRLIEAKSINGNQTTATSGTLNFTAGNVITVDPADSTTVPAPTFGTITREDSGNKIDLVPITITQDGTNIILFKRIIVSVAVNGGAFNEEYSIPLKVVDALYATNTSTYTTTLRTKRKAGVSAQYRIQAVAVGGKTSATTTSAVQGATTDDGNLVPGALVFPGAVTANSIDGDPEKNLARISLTIAAASGTFTANNVAQIEIVLIRRNAVNSADVGDPFSQIKVLATSELSASSAIGEFFLRQGQKFRVTKVIARNGDKRTETTGTLDFTAGGLLQVDSADAKTVPAPSFGTITREDSGNKIDIVPITITQDGVDIVWFKRIVVSVSVNGGTFNDEFSIPLKTVDTLYATNTSTYTTNLRIKRKSGVTAQYKAQAVAVGGKASSVTTSASQGAQTGDVLTDTGVPTLASPSTPDVDVIDGHITVDVPDLTANFQTLKRLLVVMSTSSSAPTAGVAPTVGVDGVVKIKKKSYRFKPKRPQDVTLYFYYIAENSIGFSAWSTGISLLTTGVTRPILDAVASDVPIPPERLERNATSQTGHTASTFVLDASASSINNFYQGMYIHIPSFDAGTSGQKSSNIREIGNYNGTTKVCTVTTNFDSTPSGAVSFEIWRAEIVNRDDFGVWRDHGNKSRTTHSTTTFQLALSPGGPDDTAYIGFTLYIPSFAAGDRIRKVTAFDSINGIVTVDVAFGTNHNGENHGYLIVSGSIGYSTPDNAQTQTGIAAPIPTRWYYDAGNLLWRFEPLAAQSVDAFSQTHYQINVRRSNSAMPLRGDTGPQAIGVGNGISLAASAYATASSAASIRFRNLYRGPNQDGTSDGWSDFSYWLYISATSNNYAPDIYGSPYPGDYQGKANYPVGATSY